jgi:Malectin domain
MLTTLLVMVSMLAVLLALPAPPVYETIYAENFGRNASNHTDINGVLYRSHGNRSRVASTSLFYANVVGPDQVLYNTFLRAKAIGLNISMPRTSGDYRLILKFVPSCFSPDCNFNLTLNNKHRILTDFNVYHAVQVLNKGLDHTVDFSVCDDGRLWYRDEPSKLLDWVVNLLVQGKQAVQISAVSLFRRSGTVSKVCQNKEAMTTSTTTKSTTTVSSLILKQWPNFSRCDRNRVSFQFDFPEWFGRLNKVKYSW